MKTTLAMILALACAIAACGRQDGESAAPPPPAPEAPAASAPEPAAAPPAPVPAPAPATPAAVAPVAPDVRPVDAPLGREAGLALAQQSGCLACHKIEAKLVGPAWRDVSAKYRGDAAARARLVAKVKSGGQGNWTEITGGMPMPPYSPRVPDQDIEKLVTFILSL